MEQEDRQEMTPSHTHRRYWIKLHATTSLVLLTLTFLFVGLTNTVHAAEQWQPFLESLREAGYHDMAILYLDRMAARPDCPPELKEVLDYEHGITLLSQPVSSRKEQIEKLTQANSLFEKFRTEHPDHALAVKAQTQLANVLIERGRMLVEDTEAPGLPSQKKTELIAEARKFYDEAKKVFADQDTRLTAELKALPEPKTAAETDYRDTLRADFLQTRLSLATADYEIGMTYPADDAKRKELLQSSAKQYNELYDKYGSFLAGLYARMWEGRCYQKLGDYGRATDTFESILMQADDSKAFRKLKNKSTALLLETLIDPQVKRYADAVGFYNDWEKERPPSDISTPEGLEIRYLNGLASLELARTLEENNRDRRKLISNARNSLSFVMRFPGKTRTRAREKMADPLLGVDEGEKQDPRDFAEAMEFGRAALDKIEIADIRNQVGQDKLSPEELQQIKNNAEKEALDYFEKAVTLAKPETPADQLDQTRRFIAYLSFKRGDLAKAVNLAEELAKNNADRDSDLGRSSALIAMAASNVMSTKADLSEEEKAAATKRTEAMAALIIEVWPNSKEAGDAYKILIHGTLRDKDLKKAVEMVEAIPRDTIGCGHLQMLVGRALYSEYVRQITATEEDKAEASTTDTGVEATNPEAILSQAKKLLVSGLGLALEEQQVDRSFLLGELTLARIYLNSSEDTQAVELVEQPNTGLLALAKSADPAVIEGGLDIEAYKTSLRALVGVRKLDQASEVMSLLESRVAEADTEGSGTQLMQIYISLAQELKQTLDMLQKNGKVAEAAKVRSSFEQFLDRVSSNQQAANFNVMQWIAATFSGLGDSFEAKDGSLSPEAKNYYDKAVAVYGKIVERSNEDEKFAPSVEAIDAIEIRMAICLRELGQYKDALKHLYNVLQYRNSMVDAQIEAAYTYQAWAGTKGYAKLYSNAILGGVPRTRKSDGAKINVIWGWAKLSKRFARNSKYRDLFHETRYNMSLCRYKYALSDACKDRKSELEAAERDIKVVAKLYPKMGGDEMKQKYAVLYKKIDKALGN